MRITNGSINSAKKFVFVVENQRQIQSFFKSSFSINEYEKYQCLSIELGKPLCAILKLKDLVRANNRYKDPQRDFFHFS